MKYLVNYTSNAKSQLDITRPRTYLIGSNTANAYYDNSAINLTEIYSGSGTVSTKSTGSFSYSGLNFIRGSYKANSYKYSYSTPSNAFFIDLNVSTLDAYSSKIIGIKINDGELIPGYYKKTSYCWEFESPDLLIAYGYRPGSGQGSSGTTKTQILSSDKVNLTSGNNITFKLYTW